MTIPHFVAYPAGRMVFEVLGAASDEEALRAAACEAGIDDVVEARAAVALVASVDAPSVKDFSVFTIRARAQLLLTQATADAYRAGSPEVMDEVEGHVQRLADETGRTAEALPPGRTRGVVCPLPEGGLTCHAST